MFIEKRAKLDVKELVLVTKENLQEVAEWCGGVVDENIIRFNDNTYNSSVKMIALIDDYVEKKEDGFCCWSNDFISKNYNRNEKGELIND